MPTAPGRRFPRTTCLPVCAAEPDRWRLLGLPHSAGHSTGRRRPQRRRIPASTSAPPIPGSLVAVSNVTLPYCTIPASQPEPPGGCKGRLRPIGISVTGGIVVKYDYENCGSNPKMAQFRRYVRRISGRNQMTGFGNALKKFSDSGGVIA